MTNQIKIDLDIAWDYYNTPSFNNDLANFNIIHELIELEGPAGGNPYIYLIGQPSNLEQLLAEWEYDQEDIDDLLAA